MWLKIVTKASSPEIPSSSPGGSFHPPISIIQLNDHLRLTISFSILINEAGPTLRITKTRMSWRILLGMNPMRWSQYCIWCIKRWGRSVCMDKPKPGTLMISIQSKTQPYNVIDEAAEAHISDLSKLAKKSPAKHVASRSPTLGPFLQSSVVSGQPELNLQFICSPC